MKAARSLLVRVALGCLLVSSFALPAWAEAPPRVLLELHDADAAADEAEREPLRAAVQRELPRSIEVRVAASPGSEPPPAAGDQAARLIVTRLPKAGDGKGARLRVRYEAAGGKVIEREIDVPDDPAKRRETVALLLANWVQDETDELAASLRPPVPPDVAASSTPALAAPVDTGPVTEPPRPDPIDEACLSPGRERIDDYPLLLEAFPLGHDTAAAVPPGARDPAGRVAFALSLVASHRGRVRGGALSALGGYGRRSVCGLDLASLGSQVGGPVVGAQVAGFVGLVRDLRGVQIASVGFVERSMTGAQTGGLAIAGQVHGAQIASLNVATRVRGAQLGAGNLAFESADLQLGAVNVAGQAFGQLGALNLARRSPFQLGALNLADRATVQVGVVNIADRADVPLGVVNFIRHGRTHLDIVGYDYAGGALELVHGGVYTHAVYGAGVRRSPEGDFLPVFYAGLGGHIALARATGGVLAALDVDVLSHFLPGARFRRNTQLQQLRVAATVPVGASVALLVGPTLNVSLTDSQDRVAAPSVLGDSHTDTGSTTTVRLWPGVAGGVRFF
jgi:hypothetical protein